MKKLLFILMTALALGACKKVDEAVTTAKGSAQSSQAADSTTAPQAASFGLAQPEHIARLAGSTAQTFQTSLSYTPEPIQVLYFDADGKPAQQPQAGGFYREILGKTADGRVVAQDLYQDTQTLQTAPFVFTAQGDIHSFESDGNTDSLLVQFKPDGQLEGVIDYQNGVAQGLHAVYENGRLLAQLQAPPKFMIASYYEDGQNVAAIMEGRDGPERLILFHPNGSAVGSVELDNGNPVNPRAWNAAGKAVNGQEVSTELARAETRFRYANQYIENRLQELSCSNP